MHLFGYYALVFGFILTLFLCLWTLFFSWQGKNQSVYWLEKCQTTILFLLILASGVLFVALLGRDFSFQYVRDYTDSVLPWYYALTAFWAGQEGSFVLWALFIAVLGMVWIYSPAYKSIQTRTKVNFWLFFLALQAFFLLMLITVSNPFEQVMPTPQDGNGLNPLLQHPGMIFHPPILFFGYAGFSVPACLAFASVLSHEESSWINLSRNWVILSWTFLTGGILLGAWWSYMELGWGGYWAWDPVENASLIPWLCSSAFIHTSILGRKRQSLARTNLVLIGMTMILCFFGTFLTRSGVLDSLHAFGQGQVGAPLLALMVFSLLLLGMLLWSGSFKEITPLSRLLSAQGLFILLTWLFLALGGVIVLGTLWPVLTKMIGQTPQGLGPDFYNQVCLPLFALLFVLLPFCVWAKWKSWGIGRWRFGLLIGGFIVLILFLWLFGMTKPLPLVAVSLTLLSILSVLSLIIKSSSIRKSRSLFGAYGLHLGVAVIGLGVAVSGPYKVITEAVLQPGSSMDVGEYTVTYRDFIKRDSKSLVAYQAVLQVSKQGQNLGTLRPERRMYRQFEQPFAEASVLPSLGDEIYSTLLGFNQEGVIRLQVRVNPLVNWLWIGGILVCLCGLLTMRWRGFPKVLSR